MVMVLDRGHGTLLKPVDVVWDVLSVETSVVLKHMLVVSPILREPKAEMIESLIISPI